MGFINLTGTLINYYFHCKRQCYLFYNRINLEDNSEDVRIGKVLHEINEEKEGYEISIDNVKIDKITDKYVVEIKKSDADVVASKYQLLLYLYKLKNKGIIKKGKLEFIEKNKQSKETIFIDLTEDIEAELEELTFNIEAMVTSSIVPVVLNSNKCKKCAYYTYCYC